MAASIEEFGYQLTAEALRTSAEKPPAPKPPVHLPATPPPGFALPAKRGGLFGGNK